MGYLASATTIYTRAYLTETGRRYLYGLNDNLQPIRFTASGDDLFEIKSFSLGDPDSNYKTSKRLESGDVPDLTGSIDNCLKTSVNYNQKNVIVFKGTIIPSNVTYNTDSNANNLFINVNNIN